jgi:hypothetical protein
MVSLLQTPDRLADWPCAKALSGQSKRKTRVSRRIDDV